MSVRVLLAALVVCVPWQPAHTQTAGVIKEGGGLAHPDDYATETYDVRDLLYKPGGKTGYDSVDDVIRLLVAAVHPESWAPGEKNPHTIHEQNGTAIVVHTTLRRHGAIKATLDTIRVRNDLAVDVAGVVFAIDRNIYETKLRPAFGKTELPVLTPAVTELVRKQGEVVGKGQTRIANGREGVFVSLRRAFGYAGKPGPHPPSGAFQIGFEGMSARAAITVSPDRRRVRLKLTEIMARLVGLTKETIRDPFTDGVATVETPQLVETSTAAVVDLDDGGTFLARLRYWPRTEADDRVFMLLVTPTIFIEAEEHARKQEGGRGLSPPKP